MPTAQSCVVGSTFFILLMLYKSLPFVLLSSSVYAGSISLPEQHLNLATKPLKPVEHFDGTKNTSLSHLVSPQRLKQDMSLTQQLLNKAVEVGQWHLVEQLLPIYASFPNRDKTLEKFALAGLEKSHGHLDKSIGYYRELIAENPNRLPVRFALAITLFEDNQNEAAEEQFNKVLAGEVPEYIEQIGTAYLNALTKRNQLSFNASFSFLNEKNINNVSNTRAIENTGFIKNDDMLPKSGKGLNYNFSIEKNFNLAGNHYLSLQNTLYGKSFWNNHHYDDIQNRFSIGYGFHDAKKKIAILPFYEKRWYGTSPYQDNLGIRTEFNYWVNRQFQILSAIEYAKQKFKQNDRLNGDNLLFSNTLLWLRTPKQYFFVGVDFNRERTGIQQYSSTFKNIRVGWGQEWWKGISTRFILSYGIRQYKDKAVLGEILPLNKIRRDQETNFNISIWKRDWHFWGITPKLNYNWKIVHSNLPSMYSYNKSRFMLVFEKTF